MNNLLILWRVLRDRELRRVELGMAAFAIAESGTWLAITIFAYERGGVGEAGLVSFLQLVPAALAAPFVAYAADRFPRNRALAGGSLIQAATLAITAVAILGEAPIWMIYGSAVLAAIAITFTRPAVGAIVPSLVDSPADLTAVNVAASIAEGTGMFLGPAFAGVLLVFTGPGVVFAASGALMGLVFAGTIGMKLKPGTVEVDPEEHSRTSMAELAAGLTLLGGDRDIGLLILLMTLSFMVIGALDIAFVVVAIELLGQSEATAGLFAATAGLGSVLGATGSVSLIERARLTIPVAFGVALAGVALAAVAFGGNVVVVSLLFATGGVGFSVADIAGRTMLQGLAPDDVLARIFGILEALAMAGLALGGLIFSGLAIATGAEAALIVLGLALPVFVAVHVRRLLSIDASRPEVDRALLGLVRQVPIFAPLPPYTLEQLLVNLETLTFSPDDEIIRAGDAGDRFYLIGEGSVEVDLGTSERRGLQRGHYFGEIALLRDVPRTATVTAGGESVVLYALEREVFLTAVTGHPRSLSRAETTATLRTDEIDTD